MRLVAAFAAFLASLPAAAEPLPRWTFCIATAGGDQVFTSAVFVAAAPPERLESAFAAAVARLGAEGASARCPRSREDKAVALDALAEAQKIHRERGLMLRAVTLSDFPGKPFYPQSGEKVAAR